SDARDWSGQKTETEIYDPAANVFAPAASMALRRFKLASAVAILPDGRVLVAGGASAPELYDPAKGEFLPVSGGYATPRYYATATILADGRVLITGGYGTGTAAEGPVSTADAWIFTP
ncbi:MAG: kelch-like protein, partial [Thermoanaerobaculia bacterium]